jgi:aminoglycoside 6-adenylyltransferase
MDRGSGKPAGERGAVASMDDLERRLVSWAMPRQDIRTMLIVGSRASRDRPADEWSDLDVAFTTTSPARYLATAEWLNEIGEVWVAYADPEGVTRHVLFAGGLDAGIAPLPHRALRALLLVEKLRQRSPIMFRLLPRPVRVAMDRAVDEISAYCRGGVRVILDKDGHGARALSVLPQAPTSGSLPSAEQFLAVVNEFWFLTVWNAKHLRRGELWAAKTIVCDGRMKTLLLRVIEWHARATRGAEYETWENGRHLEEWADARVLDDLRVAFGHYDDEDAWRASIATMNLFRTIATDTAQHLGLPYPTRVDAQVSDWVTRCEADRDP